MFNEAEILQSRLLIIDEIQKAFAPAKDTVRWPRGELQEMLLHALQLPVTGYTRRLVNEALYGLGFRAVKTRGKLFFHRRTE